MLVLLSLDMIKFVKPKVKTICAGVTASAAVIILLGAEKEDRYSLPNARVLIHQPSTGVQGTAADIQIEASEILKCREKNKQVDLPAKPDSHWKKLKMIRNEIFGSLLRSLGSMV